MVIAFSAASVLVALLLGFVLSWAFILPVRKMQRALAGITAGNISQHVEVPNRDEFGQLATDLNGTSERLTTLFDEQRTLATELSKTNASLVDASEAKSGQAVANTAFVLDEPATGADAHKITALRPRHGTSPPRRLHGGVLLRRRTPARPARSRV
jgi:methyl-accepting chemotaxis protein